MKTNNYEELLREHLKKPYPIEIRPIDEELGGGYVATIPSLGRDAFLAEGESVEEALSTLREVQASIFADWLQEGLTIPEPPARDLRSGVAKVLLRLPRDLHEALVSAARINGVSLNLFLVKALASHLSSQITMRENAERWDVLETLLTKVAASLEERNAIDTIRSFGQGSVEKLRFLHVVDRPSANLNMVASPVCDRSRSTDWSIRGVQAEEALACPSTH